MPEDMLRHHPMLEPEEEDCRPPMNAAGLALELPPARQLRTQTMPHQVHIFPTFSIDGFLCACVYMHQCWYPKRRGGGTMNATGTPACVRYLFYSCKSGMKRDFYGNTTSVYCVYAQVHHYSWKRRNVYWAETYDWTAG